MNQVMMRAFAQELMELQKVGGPISELGRNAYRFHGVGKPEAKAVMERMRNFTPASHPKDLGRGFSDKVVGTAQQAATTLRKKTPTQALDLRAIHRDIANTRPKDAIRAAVTRGTPVTATPTSLDQLSQMSFSSLR